MALLLFVVLTQLLQERAYPFSSFPMYANPGSNASYLYLTDAAGTPLGITHHTGLSASKLNKIFNNKLREIVRARSSEETAALEAEAGAYVIEMARRLAVKRRRALPDQVQLMRVVIERHGSELRETTGLVSQG